MLDKLKPMFHEEWWSVLEPLFNTEEGIKPIKAYSTAIKAKEYVRPKGKDLFNVYQLPISKIKVVIVGMDPYNTGNHAHGYAFSTLHEPPYSLQVILKEVYRSEFESANVGKIDELFCCGDLRQWADRGVFLLNRFLSVGREPDSHSSFGWQVITNATIQAIVTQAKHPVVFMLWGKRAQELIPLIAEPHRIITAPHPASERYGQVFVGTGVFKQANEFLKFTGQSGINWGIWPQYVESFKISVGEQEWNLPYYWERYFIKMFSPTWKEDLELPGFFSVKILDLALKDSKFRKFKFDNWNLYPEESNFMKLLWLLRKELQKTPDSKITIS